ncbi:MAG: relaxase/mobilization nuclease domain-containing protein [Oscillibacter sp.]|nr:relaxase/mobilization nuclease domain-containing protein [Oscillibacter sp.]
MRNRTRLRSMEERIQYDEKDDKTRSGELVSSYMCTPESAAQEFENSHKLYYQITGRSQPQKRDIIMYRIIQSFKPGEVSPEEANRVGYELAMKFTGGKHQFVVSTHTDKAHIHNHIEFCSINLDCDGKFQNVKDSALILRRLNDEICRAHGLSVIENPQKSAMRPGEAAAIKYGVSFKEKLRQTIDRILPESADFEDFLARMRSEGYEIKRGKYLEFRAPGQLRFTRSFRLGNDYTLDALRERCEKQRADSGEVRTPAQAKAATTAPAKKAAFRPVRNVNLLIDIQARIAAGKGPGYERWAKIFNLKEAAKTLNFLVENGLTDYDELASKAEQAGAEFDASSKKIKKLEARMSEIAQLKAHIIRYVKTREVYAAYKKARNKAEFLAAHAEEIAQHEAARKAFDALNGKPIPKVAELSKQYGELLEQKKQEYERFKQYRQEMIDFQTAKQNVDRILGIRQEEQNQREYQERQQEQQRQQQNQSY